MMLRQLLDTGYQVGSCCTGPSSSLDLNRPLGELQLKDLLQSSPSLGEASRSGKRADPRSLKRKWKQAPPAPCLLRGVKRSDKPKPKVPRRRVEKLKITKSQEELELDSQLPLYFSYEFIIGHGLKNKDQNLANGSLRPYVCPVPRCPKTYKNANGLKYHAQHGHSPPQCFLCHKCSKKYTTRNGLNAHLKSHMLNSPKRGAANAAAAVAVQNGNIQAVGVGVSSSASANTSASMDEDGDDNVDITASPPMSFQGSEEVKPELKLFRVQRVQPYSPQSFFMTLPMIAPESEELPGTISEQTLAQLSFSVGTAIAPNRARSRSRIMNRRPRRDILFNSQTELNGVEIKMEDYSNPEVIEDRYQEMVSGMDAYLRECDKFDESKSNKFEIQESVASSEEMEVEVTTAPENFEMPAEVEDATIGAQNWDIDWIF